MNGRTRQVRSIGLRLVVLALLLAASLDPRLPLPGRDLDVVFLIDASASMGAGGRDAALEWVGQALQVRDPADRAGMVLFGRDAHVAYRLTSEPPGGLAPVEVRDDATDLERAARLGAGMLGHGQRRRVVLLTDGRATQGNLDQAAAQLAEEGIGLDLVLVGQGRLADVLVESVQAPATVRQDEAYEIEVALRNDTATTAAGVLVVAVDGVTVAEQQVELAPGRDTVVVDHIATQDGLQEVTAELRSGASTSPRNDRAAAAVQVAGPPRVLVVASDQAEGDPIAAAIEAGGVGVDRLDIAQGLPGVQRLVTYDAIVLVDIPAPTLGQPAMQALDAAVRDAGIGLVTVGGDRSYGLGDYSGTVLEDLLPVSSRITDPLRRPTVAEALVVDSSESMGACHCNENAPMEEDPGAVNKTEIARQAVRRAIDQLEASDTVGVLAFDTDSRWVVPLQQVPESSVVEDGLAQLHPSGNTDIPQAIRAAVAGLRQTDAQLRHIVLFSDGFMGDLSGLVPAARDVAAEGITLSVVGTGEGSFPELQEMADVGGGRYYPGRNLAEIPDILAAEVMQVSRPLISEGTFVPTLTGIAAATADLDTAPPLLGFVATTPKPTARRLLTIGEFNDPLLATWQVGLGTATSWTSDAAPRWAANWLGWDGYQTFWSTVIKDTFPEALQDTVDVEVSIDGSDLRVHADLPTDEAGLAVTATVSDADGQRHTTLLTRAPDGGFAGTLPAEAEGVHLVTVAAEDARGTTLGRAVVPAVRTYPAEFGVAPAEEDRLLGAVQRTGGTVDGPPDQAFRREDLAAGSRGIRIWPALAVLALLLAVADVGLRRLRLERGDWQRVRARMYGAAGDQPAPPSDQPQPPSGLAALRAARDRAFDDPHRRER